MIRSILLGGALLCATLTPARAAEWKMDQAASRLEFVASYERTAAPGVFRKFDTRLRFDPDQPESGSLEVTVAVASADMRNADINKAIAGVQWFDFARYPQATFRATEIRRADPDRYLARGTLTLKGMQQAIEVPFSWSQDAGAARMRGELVVGRAAFGIGTGEWATTNVIGPDVTIRFDVRFRKND